MRDIFLANTLVNFSKKIIQKPIGLSVPGMPLGSPGMEVEGRFTPYDVLIHFRDGTTKVYAEVRE